MANENKSKVSILTNGIIKENPVLRLVLGTCPTPGRLPRRSPAALGMGWRPSPSCWCAPTS